ncbi:MAG: ATP-binding cassette domain-containing protein [Firmicutes bacterium]|nr:ATP-binding cassette domain-containing protein [Bacillota bacterium]
MLKVDKVRYLVENGAETREILKGLTLEFPDNQITAITGRNGGGKTTLAHILMGIKQPTAGKVLLDGKDITNLSISERGKLGISYAFQHPPRFQGITVWDMLRYANPEITRESACELLFTVGLEPGKYLQREVNKALSGGETKRIELATVFARRNRVLILDEPEAGVDLWSFGHLVKAIKKYAAEHDVITIIISHSKELLNIADQVVIICDGEIMPDWESCNLRCAPI